MSCRAVLTLLSLSLSCSAAAQEARVMSPPAGVPPPPPVVVHGAALAGDRRMVLEYRASDVRCGGGGVTAKHVEPVPAQFRYGPGPSAPVVLRFRIDGDGRPLGIARDAGLSMSPDLVPSFVAWQFAAGAPQDGCEVTFYPILEPIDQAAPDVLRRMAALGRFRPENEPRLVDRIAPANSTCVRNWPQVTTQVYPEFDTIPAEPGTVATTGVGFDIDHAGMPVNVRTLSSDGNDALDAAGRDAVARWRYAGGPRTGCFYPYVRAQHDPVPAPVSPEPDTLQPAGATCGAGHRWETPPELVYPEPYRRRAIEGWAVIAFDVAPWGVTGNVRVIAAEPSAEFGDAAKRIVERSRKASSALGASGCTEKVLFQMRARPNA